jgi:hypothetical protein
MSWWSRDPVGRKDGSPLAQRPETADRAEPNDPASAPDVEAMLLKVYQGSMSHRDLWPVVCAFTDERRLQGEPIEKIIVHLKEVLARVRVAAWRTLTPSGRAVSIDDTAAQAIHCCIAHFYGQWSEHGPMGGVDARG